MCSAASPATTAISGAVDSSFTLVEERGSGKRSSSCIGRRTLNTEELTLNATRKMWRW